MPRFTILPAALVTLLATGASAPAQSPAVPPAPSEAGTAQVWKSQTTGHEYRVRIEGDVLHADWVNVPPDMARQGAYVRTECRRVGSKWIGTTRSRLLLPCTEVTAPDGRHPSGWCALVTRTEIDSISPQSITGRAQASRRLDCKSCKLLEAEWKDFSWTPKP